LCCSGLKQNWHSQYSRKLDRGVREGSRETPP